MTKVKKAIIIFVFLLFAVSFYSIDQYIYSLTGWFAHKTGTCQSKLIKPSTVRNNGFKKLGFPADLPKLSQFESNLDYITDATENSVSISRRFDDFDYKIVFENRTAENDKAVYYQYSISCRNCEKSSTGENCTTPDFEIYKKVYKIINDLPLGDRTRREILSGLTIYYQDSSTAISRFQISDSKLRKLS